MEPFEQHIEPLGRGRICYRIHCWNGWKEREGRQLTLHFAAEREGGFWWVTHLPSGKGLSLAHRRTLAEVTAMCERLETIAAWGRVTRGSDRLARKTRVITGGQPVQRVG